MKDAIEYKDEFIGAGDYSDRYGTVGGPTPATDSNGAALILTGGGAEEVAIHLDNKRQIDSSQLVELIAEFNVDDAEVLDGNSVFIGLIGDDYASGLKSLTEYAGFEVAASGANNSNISFVGADGVNTIAVEATGLLASRVNRVCINLARGWEQVEVSVNGKPVGGYHDLTALKGTNLQLVAQAKGTAANTLTLASWSFRSRKAI